MIKLWIENQEMDTTEGFSHQITYAIDDLNNLDSKATSFSKTIVLPGTANNNKLLGNIFEFANSNFTGNGPNVFYNFNASRSAKCRLDINGLTIIKGVMRLLEIIRDEDSIEYEVAIFGELGGFFSKLSNKKLEDLDFSVYNHQYTVANITDRWDDKPDWIYVSEDSLTDAVLPNFVELFTSDDLTTIIKVGDEVNVKNADDNTDYGNSFVTSVIFNPNEPKNTINLSTSLTGTPGTTIKVRLSVINKGGANVYYPLIDYGTYSSNKLDYKVKTFRPALFVREYIHKIILGCGYTYESKFFETDFFKRLIIPHNESILQTIKSDLFSATTGGALSILNQPSPYNGTGTSYIVKNYGDLFTTSDNITYTYNGVNTEITIFTGIDYKIENKSLDAVDFIITARLKQNGNIVKSSSNNHSLAPAGSTKIGYGYLSLSLDNLNLINGDDLMIDFTINAVNVNAGNISFYFTQNNSNVRIYSIYPITAPIELNDVVELSKAIPKNIMQKDFFASIIKMFNLMVTEDKFKDRHLKIEPNIWFFNLNPSEYLNWSDKLDRSQPIRIRPMSEINARYYDFKFKSDSDYYNDLYKKRYNEGYGDRKYDNELEFAKDNQSTEVIFASTPLLGYQERDKIVPTIFKWDGATIGTNEERVNSIIRIMQIKNIGEVDEYLIKDDLGNNLLSISEYPYAGHLDHPTAPITDLNFGATKELFYTLSSGTLSNNVFNIYYSPYMAEITDKDSRLVIAKFKFNDTDIFNLDFSRFIWLDGVLYRLSRIVDYTPGEICTVELLRVIYTTYDSSVNSAEIPEIEICGQIWSQKNLDTEYYANGDLIPQVTDPTDWANLTEGAWCWYDNDPVKGNIYGKLYNWYAVTDPRGLAPQGWVIPSSNDFRQLYDSECLTSFRPVTNIPFQDPRRIKYQGTEFWNTNNGINSTKFNALGSGRRKDSGTLFEEEKDSAYYWTSDEDLMNANNGIAWYLKDTDGSFTDNAYDKNFGFSVRLLRP